MNTKNAALVLGLRPATLARAVWDGRVAEPARCPAGNFLWTEADLDRACRVMRGLSLAELRAKSKLSEGA